MILFIFFSRTTVFRGRRGFATYPATHGSRFSLSGGKVHFLIHVKPFAVDNSATVKQSTVNTKKHTNVHDAINKSIVNRRKTIVGGDSRASGVASVRTSDRPIRSIVTTAKAGAIDTRVKTIRNKARSGIARNQ